DQRAATVDRAPPRGCRARARAARGARAHASVSGGAARARPAARAHARAAAGRSPAGPRARPAGGARTLLPPRGARGDLGASRPRDGTRRHELLEPADPLAADAMGVVLAWRAHELQLAPAARARARARLRRVARGLPPGA